MKKVFYTHLGYIYMSILLILISLVAFIFPLISLIQNYNDQTSAKIIIVIISFLVTIFFVIIFGFAFIQWVEIDDRKIVARSLFHTILDVKWIDVNNIYIDSFTFSHKDVFVSKWIVFDDGRKNTFRGNGLNIKRSFIKIKYSEKNIKIIEEFWKNEIYENKNLIV